MPITFETLPPEGFILEIWSGEVSIEEVRRHWSKMLQDDTCLAYGRTLADLRGATLLFSDSDLLAAIDEVGVPALNGREWVSAIVVRRPAQLRLASRYQGFASRFSRDAIFSQVEEAKRWLLNQS